MSLVAGSYERFIWGFTLKPQSQSQTLTLTPLFSYPSHLSLIKTVAISGSVVASGGADDTIHLYNLSAAASLGSLHNNSSTVTALSFYTPPDLLFPRNLISAAADGSICLYDADGFVHLKTLPSVHRKAINDLALHPSGKLALTVGRDECLAMVNLVRGRRSFCCRLGKEASLVKYDSSGEKFFMAMEEKVSVHEAEDARLLLEFECPKRVLCAAPAKLMKKLHFNRHYSFLASNLRNSSTKESHILQHCKDGSLPQALILLNTLNTSSNTLKPILYASLLQTCIKTTSFTHGTQLHAHVLKSGLQNDRFVGNSLLSLYFKLSPHFNEARTVFDTLYVKDVISWTSMISGYVQVGEPHKSLGLFFQMVGLDVEPNGFTLSSVIKACSELGDLKLGRCFHGVVINHGFDSNHVIISALIDMYGRNHGVGDARKLFDELPQPDAVCWTSVISAFTRNDMFKEALEFFYVMHRDCGLAPDGFTFGTLLAACGNLGWLRQGKEVHAKVVTSGICGNVVVESSLLDMYGKCGSVRWSRIVFDGMSNKNSVSWTAMLGVYCQNGECETVLNLVRERRVADLYSFGTILRACSGLAAVRQGKEVHCQYVRKGGWRDVIVESAMVDLYAKCGCIDFAHRLFLAMQVRNLITWNSMIGGFAQNGRGTEALALFEDMIKEGMKPDYITFINVLFACSHTGLVDQGRKYFASMTKEYGIKPGVEHYNCMIDLLGRADLIEEAENLLENAECRHDQSLWAVLLGACTKCSDYITAERIARKMIEMEPDFHLSYVLLGNIYRAVGRWNDALEIRKLMEDRGVKKMPGKSWIESENQKGSRFDLTKLSIAVKSSVSSMGEAV